MNSLPTLSRNHFLLVIAPPSDGHLLLELMVRLALRSSPFIIDGGNTFQGFQLAAMLKRRTPDPDAALRRTRLSRVFTCYQMHALLSEIPSDDGEAARKSRVPEHPIIVLDFLSTFYDQSVPAADRGRMLNGCIAQLRRLSRVEPLAVWVRRREMVPPEGLNFLAQLEASAGQVWAPSGPGHATWKQSGLFHG